MRDALFASLLVVLSACRSDPPARPRRANPLPTDTGPSLVSVTFLTMTQEDDDAGTDAYTLESVDSMGGHAVFPCVFERWNGRFLRCTTPVPRFHVIRLEVMRNGDPVMEGVTAYLRDGDGGACTLPQSEVTTRGHTLTTLRVDPAHCIPGVE